MPEPTRPSLLWPGLERERLQRWDLWLLGAVALLAFVVRWTIRDAHPYTAEAAHYAMSLHLWHGVDNVRSLFPDVAPDDFSWFFWQRPLLCLLYWPVATLGGFEAYRTAHILVASTVPALAATLLRQLGTRPVQAYGAAVVLAVHPVLVPWGVLVLPDTTVAALTLAGLLAAHDGRPWTTAVLLLMAAWVKEVGFVTAGALLVLAAWRDADGRRGTLWPLRVGRFATLMIPVIVLSFLPLVVSLTLPNGIPPGFRVGGSTGEELERLFLLVWLAPLAGVGLLLPRVRALAFVALAWVAFFVLYHALTGKAVEVWYFVVPATLVLCAAAATLSHLVPPDPMHAWMRWVRPAATVAFALLLSVQVAVPQGNPMNPAVATPFTHTGQWDLREALHYEEVRDDGLFAVLDTIPPDHEHRWLALNMDYSIVMHPLATRAGFVYKDYTLDWTMTDDSLRWWADAVENRTEATILGSTPDALSRALVEAYEPCTTTVESYSAIVPDLAPSCHGNADRLIAAWHHQRSVDGT